MSRKLLIAVAGVMVVSLCFASLLAQVRASQSVEGIANRLHQGLLERGAETLVRGGSIDRLARDPALGSQLILLDVDKILGQEEVAALDAVTAGM